MTSQGHDDEPAPKPSTRMALALTIVRRAVAVLVLLALATSVGASYLLADFHVCRQEATTTAITTCGPVGPADLPALGIGLFIVLLLLLPDLEEFAIPGLVSLKVRVKEQEREIARLGLSVQQLQLNQTNVNIGYPPVMPDLQRTAMNVQRKTQDFVRYADTWRLLEPEFRPQTRDVSPDRAIAEVALLDLWEKLSRFVPWTPAGRQLDEEAFSAQKYRRLRAWAEAFGQELRDLQTIRNTVAHLPQNLADEQIFKALGIGRALQDSLAAVLDSE